MNPIDAVNRRLMALAMTQGAAIARPLAQTAMGATALRAGIHYEAFVRAQHRQSSHAVSALTGHQTQQQRWAQSEQQQRRRLAPDRPAEGMPTAFWHGPGRVTGTRPVVVLVNGWTASGLLWPAQFVDRLQADADVVRVDNRGSGWSRTAPAPFTIAQLADDVAQVMRYIGASAATVVGLSMGGMIAQEVAIRHPALVARLVLCGTRPPSPAGFLPAAAVLESMIAGPRAGEPFRQYVHRSWATVVGPGFARSNPDVMDEMVDQIARRPTPRAGVLTQMRAIASWHGPQRLAQIAAPTTVIHGVDDPLIPVGNGMRLAQSIAGSRYVELAGVGHIVPFEAPDVVADAITG